MLKPQSFFAIFTLAWFAMSASEAQDYPNKPIRLFTQPAGGGADLASRLTAPGITGSSGQQVVIDNRTGTIPIEIVAKSPPDGYNLLIFSNGMWLMQYMRSNVSWDTLKDFAPITLVATAPNILVVHPSLPAKSVNDVIALAKSRPGQLNYASNGTASMNQLAAELLNAMAHIRTVHVPYKGGAPALSAVIAGEVDIIFGASAPTVPHVKSGRLRALAITSANPSSLFPGLPTMAQFMPGYEANLILGVFAPVKTPDQIIARLNQAISQHLKTPEIREKFLNAGSEVVASSPAELSSTVTADMARWAKVIKGAGIRDE
jgi:tripartite-type tricarboxylate transporter receptor subunit TctC